MTDLENFQKMAPTNRSRASTIAYDCLICEKVMYNEDSIRRHLFSSHNKFESETLVRYYKARERYPKLLASPIKKDENFGSKPNKRQTNEINKEERKKSLGSTTTKKRILGNGSANSTGPSSSKPKSPSVCDVGCQVDCMDCKKKMERLKELETLFLEVTNTEKMKAVLEKKWK